MQVATAPATSPRWLGHMALATAIDA